MKLIVTTVDNVDVDKVLKALTDQRIKVTHVSSSGGFLRPGNSTLLMGVDDQQVEQATKLITDMASTRNSVAAYPHGGIAPVTGYVEVQVGGFMSFVLNVDHFEQV